MSLTFIEPEVWIAYRSISIFMMDPAPMKMKEAATRRALKIIKGLTDFFLHLSQMYPQTGEAIELAPSLIPNSRPT